MIQHQNELEIHLEAYEGELLDDYELALVHMEDFQLDFKQSLHENVQDTIDIPLEGQNLIEDGSLLVPQEDELTDFQAQVQVKQLTLALEEENEVYTKIVEERFKKVITLR